MLIILTMKGSVKKGNLAEELAASWLEDHGFKIRERNYRIGHKEVDIIAESREKLHVVEVKSLTAPSLLNPSARVDLRKQTLLSSAASYYIKANGISKEVQFDIISIIVYPDRQDLEYLPNAFWPIYYK